MRNFELTHIVLPAAALAVLMALLLGAHLDMRAADAWFYDGNASRWIGAHTWWATDLLHTGGRNVVRLVAFGALVAIAASFASPRWRQWRRGATYVALALLLST